MRCLWLWLVACAFAVGSANAQTNRAAHAEAGLASSLLEATGRVEFQAGAGGTNWQAATVGLSLQPGDRVRTLGASRAAVQLSDRSVIRLQERTTLELLPPRRVEKKRFGLPAGALYFFNREKPAEVEFDTPLAAGAIRGTEFLLTVAPGDGAVQLALIDGRVALATGAGEIALERGEELRLAPGQPPVKTALVNATAKIQWALYYPAVVDSDELPFAPEQRAELQAVLEQYRAGDLPGALAAWPATRSDLGAGGSVLRAQLELAVGRVAAAETLLNGVVEIPAAGALRELIGVVRGDVAAARTSPAAGASSLLAHSYALQARTQLVAARDTALTATRQAPQFGFARARLAELEFALGHRSAALVELELALQLSPRLAAASALRGFVLLEDNDAKAALASFELARAQDPALGAAWLGRGLCLLRTGQPADARASFQAAAALEPQRSLFRSYLGKAASELGEARAAEKEFRLAQELDANDPTPWLYSALHRWQASQLNAAVRDLETSSDKNDNRAAFRSRELLDEDRSVRSANLAALYADAGLAEVSRHAATRAVDESHANFSGHLFLANSYQAEADGQRFDLRLESARQSELLVANLLAPAGAGNLSQLLSESDRLRFFAQRPFGLSSLTRYGSRGDWSELATAFGSFAGFSYALDTRYQSLNGQRVNHDSLEREFALTLKQRVTSVDDAYFQLGSLQSRAGDLTSLYDPAAATPELRVTERQQPDVYAGWHHAWSPGSHTLFLVARLDDKFSRLDPQSDQIFFFRSASGATAVQSPPIGPAITNVFSSRFTLWSAELQQVFEAPHHGLVLGGRWQAGDVASSAVLQRTVDGNVTEQAERGGFTRGSAYGYYTWRPVTKLSLTAGATFDHLAFPENTDFAPVSFRETSRDQLSPKAGLLFTPWQRGLLRASYTRSLGGLFFDNSVRLEPTLVGGFNQTFRSLIPESVAGLLPGATFETASLGFDQSFARGTFFGVEAGWLTSGGRRIVGVLTNSTGLPLPDTAGSTRQTLAFRERNLSAYAAQLLGDYFSVSARYRWSEADLATRFPDFPDATAGLNQLESNNRAVLQQISLTLNFSHPSGVFGQWESAWSHQDNTGYTPGLPAADFWQHDVVVGYRFPRRQAELRLGVLNLFAQDYRLNPLNLHAELPASRTFTASLRLNF